MKAQIMSMLRGLQMNDVFNRDNKSYQTSVFIQDEELFNTFVNKVFPMKEIIISSSNDDEQGLFVRLRVEYPQFESGEVVKKFKEKVGVKND